MKLNYQEELNSGYHRLKKVTKVLNNDFTSYGPTNSIWLVLNHGKKRLRLCW